MHCYLSDLSYLLSICMLTRYNVNVFCIVTQYMWMSSNLISQAIYTMYVHVYY